MAAKLSRDVVYRITQREEPLHRICGTVTIAPERLPNGSRMSLRTQFNSIGNYPIDYSKIPNSKPYEGRIKAALQCKGYYLMVELRDKKNTGLLKLFKETVHEIISQVVQEENSRGK